MRNQFTARINASIERVFDFCVDPSNFLALLPSGAQVTQDPPTAIGVGTVFRFTRSGVANGTVEVQEFDRPRRFVTVTDNGSNPFVTVNTFEQDGDSTLCHIDGQVVTRGIPQMLRPLWWVLLPLLRPVISRANQRVVAAMRMALET